VIITVLRIEPIEDHAGQRPASIAGTARDSITPLTTRPEWGSRQGEAEDRDVVEVVADLALPPDPSRRAGSLRFPRRRSRNPASGDAAPGGAIEVEYAGGRVDHHGEAECDWASFSHVLAVLVVGAAWWTPPASMRRDFFQPDLAECIDARRGPPGRTDDKHC